METHYDKLKELQRLRSQYRCCRCKTKSYEDMITCQRCLEVQYCSYECFYDDTDSHKQLCLIIGGQKGLVFPVFHEEAEFVDFLRERATFLDKNGDIKVRWLNKYKKEESSTKSSCTRAQSAFKKGHQKRGKGEITTKDREQNDAFKKTDKNREKRSIVSLITGGDFGGPVVCDAKTLSGETFAKGWWNSKPARKVSTDTFSSPKASSDSKIAQQEQLATQKSAVLSNAWDDGATIKHKTLVKEGSEYQTSATASALSFELPAGGATGQELVPFDKALADDKAEKQTKHKTCAFCKKEGQMLECSRCQAVGYCNKQCQVKDFKGHKDTCKRIDRFHKALWKLKSALCLISLFGMQSARPVSPFLKDLPTNFQYLMLGASKYILLEIISPYYHPFRYGCVVRDLNQEVTHILFYDNSGMYTRGPVGFSLIPLSLCIQPGNFILLLDSHWHGFLDGTVGVRIDDLNSVHFIFMD